MVASILVWDFEMSFQSSTLKFQHKSIAPTSRSGEKWEPRYSDKTVILDTFDFCPLNYLYMASLFCTGVIPSTRHDAFYYLI